jgi:bacterioferritin-associated ferredoxin
MIVCLCHAVSDRTVRQLARDGRCSTVGDVARACGAGSDCGACAADLARILRVERSGGPRREEQLAAK